MAFSTSRLMRLTVRDMLAQQYTTMNQVDLDAAVSSTSTTVKCALYDNGVTPDFDAATTLSTYGGASSTWVSTGSAVGATTGSTPGQVYHTGQWAQGVLFLPSPVVSNTVSGTVTFGCGPIVSGASTTMSGIYGMILYFSTATSGGQTAPVLGYWAFGAGSPYSVTSGTLTITNNVSGLFTLTV